MRPSPFVALIAIIFALGCDKAPEAQPTRAATPTSRATAPASAEGPLPEVETRYEAVERVVAIGDVHGDLAATKAALKLAGLIDASDDWTGGATVLVQTGDILDRGDDEQAILDLFEKLEPQAKGAGGAVHVLHGNHELMNVAGDFRYVTPGGFADFAEIDVSSLGSSHAASLGRFPPEQRPRAAAFFPGGVYAKKIADHPVVLVVGDNVFAHGGVLPRDAAAIERLNAEVAAWLLGRGSAGASVISRPDSPVWSRHYADDPDPSDCKLLDQSLGVLKAKRMVVGHTPQKTISSACDDRVWRIDVGMAAHYGGSPQALEITADGVRVLKR